MTETSQSQPVAPEPHPSHRMAGILLHPTSLPGPWGVGDFGPSALDFLDWAASSGFSLWQVLPLHPSSAGDSPYSTLSAFALDPLFISLEGLMDDGLLRSEDLPEPVAETERCDFEAARHLKEPALRLAWQRFRDLAGQEHEAPDDATGSLRQAFESFREHPAQQVWLEDWCLFAALREQGDRSPWWTWDAPLRDRQPEALDRARLELEDAIGYARFLQFCAFRQWQHIRQAARQRGIRILGDIPIYVAHDSAEVWTHPHLFELDGAGQPIAVAGVPPDYFAEDGQLWGNPLYRWETLAEDDYAWWVQRLRGQLELADLIRLDHFRAFADYWRVPAEADTARNGTWVDGPGKAFFDALETQLGTPLPLMAEDLGDLSDAVHVLRKEVGLPCMKVLHFGFDSPDSDHAPFRLDPKTLLYTGTHDNNTTVGWFRDLNDDHRRRVRVLLGTDGTDIHRHLMRSAMTSVARWAVIPMQDVLGLDSAARMNVPGVAEGNWRWRLRKLPGDDEARWLRELLEVSGRLSP